MKIKLVRKAKPHTNKQHMSCDSQLAATGRRNSQEEKTAQEGKCPVKRKVREICLGRISGEFSVVDIITHTQTAFNRLYY